MKKILITGASGFVGKNLLQYLTKTGQYHIDVITRDAKNFQDNGLFEKAWTYDEFKTLPWDDYDVIIHLAGLAHDTSARRYREEDYKNVNLDLVKKIFDEFIKHRASVFIYISTSKVYDEDSEVLSEHSEVKPKDFYSGFKRDSEEYIQKMITTDKAGKSYYILRPSMIHGPYNKGNLNALFTFVSKRIPYPLASFQNRRSYLFADNLSFVMDRIMQQKPASGIYNVADDNDISTAELVRIISEEANKKILMLRISPALVRFVFWVGDKIGAPVNTTTLKKLVGTRVILNDKIKTALGIQRFPVPLQEGLRRTIRSFSQSA